MTREDFINQSGLALTAFALPFPLSAFTKHNRMTNKTNFEVIIIGGSYAGLSAAMSLGRSLRNVLIIDNGFPCNRQTPHSHNFLTQDGKTPNEIATIAKQEVEKYGTIKFHQGLALSAIKTTNGYEITTDTNDKFTGKKLILATGIKDVLPEIKGFSECWGITIIHCPYCHGYEHRNQNTAIIGNGPKAFHLASMVNNLTSKVTLLTNGKADFSVEQIDKLSHQQIKIVESEIVEIENENGHIQNVNFKNNSQLSFDIAYGVVTFLQQSEIPISLGCELTEHGYIKINPLQCTNVDGVFACGDNSNMMRSVANAVNSGNITGAIVNGGLVQETF